MNELEKYTSGLNKGQLNAFKSIVSSNAHIDFITAPAGMGKTYLVNKVIKYYKEVLDMEKIIALAPSHAAKAVLHEHVKEWDVEVATIQSHCGFIPKGRTPSGEEIFKWNNNIPKDKDLVVIDEASMVSQDMFNVLLKSECKIILLGDDKQLKAVGDSSMDFTGIPTYTLTEQMRQKNKDSNLSKVLVALREAIDNPTTSSINNIKELLVEDDSLHILRGNDSLPARFIDDKDTDKVMLAATNAVVNRCNKYVKSRIGDEMYEVGDLLILQQPWWEKYSSKSPKSTAHNGTVIQLMKVTPTDYENYLEVEFNIKGNLGIPYKALLPVKEYKHKELLQTFAADRNWETFYKSRNETISAKHTYSMTAWKSQGSTFNSVYIDHGDIENILAWKGTEKEKLDTYLRAVYVALSRAKEKVVIKL